MGPYKSVMEAFNFLVEIQVNLLKEELKRSVITDTTKSIDDLVAEGKRIFESAETILTNQSCTETDLNFQRALMEGFIQRIYSKELGYAMAFLAIYEGVLRKTVPAIMIRSKQ